MNILLSRNLGQALLRTTSVHIPTGRYVHFTSVLDKLVQFNLSDIGEGIAEVQVKEWHVKVGDKVSEFDNVCEVQSDKASVTITSRYEGVIKKLYFNVDDMAKVGQPLIDIEVGDDESATKSTEEKTDVISVQSSTPSETNTLATTSQSLGSGQRILATPAVRRLIKENKVDLERVTGTGRDGRVLKEDVLRFIGELTDDKPSTPFKSETATQTKVYQAKQQEDKVVPIRGYTRIMIKTMTEALKIPHFGFSDEFTVDALVEIREHLKHEGKKRGVKFTYMPIFIKAASMALLRYPVINSSMDEKMENVIYKSSHNISIAMDTPGGLVVPNVKNCEQKSIWEIAAELNRLQENGSRQQLSREDLNGGTFALSNVGILGGTYAKPVILPPQVAIGAIGRIRKVPRFASDGVTVRPVNIVNVSWAADHRVIDGATMARFSNLLKEYIENPAKLIAELR
jgi:2-oxoisovalerate dehydrogenase E2 component (dihydrolipoyl transacylase)